MSVGSFIPVYGILFFNKALTIKILKREENMIGKGKSLRFMLLTLAMVTKQTACPGGR